MKKEEIQLWDLKRILLGQAPPEFLLEVLIRSLVVYLAAVVVMRWMGKRMNGQHSIIEISVMVMMGAIISAPMQVPDRGILQGILVLLVTLFLLRSLNGLSFKKPAFEEVVLGKVSTLVVDGVLQKQEMNRRNLTNQHVFEVLRGQQIYNLAAVKRMYLEACGAFSVYKEENPGPGLPLYPPADKAVLDGQKISPDKKACSVCGTTAGRAAAACSHCQQNEWTTAIETK